MAITQIKTLKDPDLGEIIYRINSLAKSYSIRVFGTHVVISMPPYGNLAFAQQFFWKHHEWILNKRNKIKERTIHNEVVLRQQALQFLPAELQRLADLHGFTFKHVCVRKSRTRWGACNSRHHISLSFFLMLCPPHLIEYVLLHELCHTVEMNHGENFWALLDKCTNGQARQLAQELRNFSRDMHLE